MNEAQAPGLWWQLAADERRLSADPAGLALGRTRRSGRWSSAAPSERAPASRAPLPLRTRCTLLCLGRHAAFPPPGTVCGGTGFRFTAGGSPSRLAPPGCQRQVWVVTCAADNPPDLRGPTTRPWAHRTFRFLDDQFVISSSWKAVTQEQPDGGDAQGDGCRGAELPCCLGLPQCVR